MTTRNRRRRRRPHNVSWKKKLLLVAGVCAGALAIAGGVAASWAINVYDSAPPLSSLKPVQKGRSSAIYAADGSLIGFIRSSNIRQPVPSQRPAAGPQERHGRDRGQELLRPRGDRPGRDRPRRLEGPAGRRQAGPGRLDDHPAAGPQPLHPATPKRRSKRKLIEAHLAEEVEDSPLQGLDPHRLPEHGAVRDGRRGDRGRRRGGGADLLRQAGRELTLTEAALIAGLPQAPSEYNPFLDPEAALKRRNEVLGVMREQGYIDAGRIPRGGPQRPRAEPGPQVPGHPRPLPLRPRPAGADRQVRDQHRPQRRAEGLHDDRPEPAGTRAGSGRTPARSATRTAAPPRRWPRSTRRTARSSPSPRPRATPSESQFNYAWQAHRQPGSSFKTYVLTTAIKQGIDPYTTYYDGTSPKTLELPGGGTWTVNNAEPGWRVDVARRGHLELGQRRLRPARPRRRPRKRDRNRPRDGNHSAAGIGAGRGDRRPAGRRHAARNGRRLRDARRRRHPPRRDRDQQGRVPERQGRRTRTPNPATACSPRARPTR